MPRAGNLKINSILAFQLDFAVIHSPRTVHRAIQPDQGVTAEARISFGSAGVILGGLNAGLHGHSVRPRLLKVSGASTAKYTEIKSRRSVRRKNRARLSRFRTVQFGLLRNCHPEFPWLPWGEGPALLPG
jgi:hypothetical protein